MPTPEDFRKDFPILNKGDYIYFDNAATSQRPNVVVDAIKDFYENSNANPLRGLYDWSVDATDRYEMQDVALGPDGAGSLKRRV